jgi:hypothetical protein
MRPVPQDESCGATAQQCTTVVWLPERQTKSPLRLLPAQQLRNKPLQTGISGSVVHLHLWTTLKVPFLCPVILPYSALA